MNFLKINKNIRKIKRNVKAISPVISVLLMIAVAVVASLVVYAWVMGYVGFTTDKTGKAIQIQSMTNSDVYVQNVGNSAVTFNNPCVYVDGVSNVATSGTGNLIAGSTTTLHLTTAITSGSHTVKVASSDGTFSQVTQTFP